MLNVCGFFVVVAAATAAAACIIVKDIYSVSQTSSSARGYSLYAPRFALCMQ